jgi:hypothetical protein
MRILVIDDMRIHLDAARQTLAGHDLVTCNTYDEAVEVGLLSFGDILCLSLIVLEIPNTHKSVKKAQKDIDLKCLL